MEVSVPDRPPPDGEGTDAELGVFHETYIIDRHESIYVNMPERFGLGGATTLVPPGRRGHRAAHRLDPTIPDTPAVDPG